MSRRCGPCTLCCELMAIEALAKPQGQKCVHQFSGGCRVYADRPGECRNFSCQWLLGAFSRRHRPDRMGAVVANVEGHVYIAARGPRQRDAMIAVVRANGWRGDIETWGPPHAEADRPAEPASVGAGHPPGGAAHRLA